MQSLKAEPLSGEVHSSPLVGDQSENTGSASDDAVTVDKKVDSADGSFDIWLLIGGLGAAIPLCCLLALLWARCRYRRRVSKEEWHSELSSMVCTRQFQLLFSPCGCPMQGLSWPVAWSVLQFLGLF